MSASARDQSRDLPAWDDNFVLPSRQRALRSIEQGSQGGMALLTGEAGVGKTWLAERFQRADKRRWVSLDISTTTTPPELLGAIGKGLGWGDIADRWELGRLLEQETKDGHRYCLAIDESHLAPWATLEEMRILSNRLGRADGFGGILVIGQTELLPRLAERPLQGFDSRFRARVHLRPLDADEAYRLLDAICPGGGLDVETSDELHRLAEGNPVRLMRLRLPAPMPMAMPIVETGEAPPQPSITVREAASSFLEQRQPVDASESFPTEGSGGEGMLLSGVEGEGAVDQPTSYENAFSLPGLMGDTPVQTLDPETIEVGWDEEEAPGAASSPLAAGDEDEVFGKGGLEALAEVEEVVRDHLPPGRDEEPVALDDPYASLQAWNEWIKNEALRRRERETGPGGAVPESGPDSFEGGTRGEHGSVHLRREGQHGFAPSGPLFQKAKKNADPNS